MLSSASIARSKQTSSGRSSTMTRSSPLTGGGGGGAGRGSITKLDLLRDFLDWSDCDGSSSKLSCDVTASYPLKAFSSRTACVSVAGKPSRIQPVPSGSDLTSLLIIITVS